MTTVNGVEHDEPMLLTTQDVANELGRTRMAVLKRAKRAGIEPKQRLSGTRGFLWTEAQVEALRKAAR